MAEKLSRVIAAGKRIVPRSLRAHAFIGVVVVAVLIGAGLRFIPTGDAAAAGSAGQGAAASTACAATP
jgi:tetrahydromethanopterin S-methyltransferase subunit D